MNETFKKALAKGGPFLGLLLVVVLFALAVPLDDEGKQIFFTYRNFKIIFTQTVIVSIGALGMTLIIVSGGIDLSVGSAIALTSVAGAMLIQRGWETVAVLLAMVACGGFIGLLNGAAIAGLRMTPFIITLGTLGVARGGAKWMADNQTVNYEASPLNNLDDHGGPVWLRAAGGCLGGAGAGDSHGARVEKHGLRSARVCARLERGDGAAVRHSDDAVEDHDLRDRGLLLWVGGIVSTFTAAAG
jgi:ABC-type xylose transport system permease subunit